MPPALASEPIVMDAGRAHRIRLVAIGIAGGDGFTLRRGGKVAEWRALAKDGWTLPASQATMRPAVQRVATGETFDFVNRRLASSTVSSWHSSRVTASENTFCA